MSIYLVITPEYGEVIPVLDYGQGPMEYGCDTCWIEAESKEDARYLGVKVMIDKGYPYYANHHYDNPYTGVTVEEHFPCSHGFMPWRWDREKCQPCIDAMDPYLDD